ncbi:MAG TPA: DUF4430 domain-containing protein [Candidatus Sulfotelmatobacter sp.]|jgi:hypothetical protein|nr:DUF4430 domain-containing protein [Candidatus Sulfotelmatobacter sp.]
MKHIHLLSKIAKKHKQTSPLLMLSGVFLFASVIFAFYSQNHNVNTKPSVKGISYAAPTKSPTSTPTQTPTTYVTSVPRKIITFSSQTPTQTIKTNQPVSSSNVQGASTQKSSSTSIPTSTPKPIVNIQIREPDGTLNFTVNLNSGNNLCDNLTEAKNEGKIKSLTFDNSYMSTMHSAYVREINGYQNNWTVSVNDKTPQGCSLYTPNAGDSITWKFG